VIGRIFAPEFAHPCTQRYRHCATVLAHLEAGYKVIRERVTPGPKQFKDRKSFEEAVAETKHVVLWSAGVQDTGPRVKAGGRAGSYATASAPATAAGAGENKAATLASGDSSADPFPADTAALLADFAKRHERDAASLQAVFDRAKLGGVGLMAALKKCG
jgi:hypothetical protein